ncbi:MAG TPA: hydrogenase maturation protease [Terrimicrobiaceae bacterium]
MTPRILIAGVGNIFAGDDAFGVEVIREMARHPLPETVLVKDFGIRSYDLAYALMDGYSATILVDAASRGHPPGTVYLIEPDVEAIEGEASVDAHSMNPVAVLQLVRALGGSLGRLYVVGCEPEVLESEEIGLSPNVSAAVPQAVQMIESLVHRLIHEKVSPAFPL